MWSMSVAGVQGEDSVVGVEGSGVMVAGVSALCSSIKFIKILI